MRSLTWFALLLALNACEAGTSQPLTVSPAAHQPQPPPPAPKVPADQPNPEAPAAVPPQNVVRPPEEGAPHSHAPRDGEWRHVETVTDLAAVHAFSADAALCQASGGRWQPSRLSCYCEASASLFRSGHGCVSPPPIDRLWVASAGEAGVMSAGGVRVHWQRGAGARSAPLKNLRDPALLRQLVSNITLPAQPVELVFVSDDTLIAAAVQDWLARDALPSDGHQPPSIASLGGSLEIPAMHKKLPAASHNPKPLKAAVPAWTQALQQWKGAGLSAAGTVREVDVYERTLGGLHEQRVHAQLDTPDSDTQVEIIVRGGAAVQRIVTSRLPNGLELAAFYAPDGSMGAARVRNGDEILVFTRDWRLLQRLTVQRP